MPTLVDADCFIAGAEEPLGRAMQNPRSAFAAQFQQNPTPADGNMIKAAWLLPYDNSQSKHVYKRIILSCDPAGKAGLKSDYTAIVVCGFTDKDLHVLHASRGHWTVMDMQHHIEALSQQFGVGLVIIEDTASGSGLLQLLKERAGVNAIGRHPSGDKETRLLRHQGRFEAGRIFIPKEAPWRAEFVGELLAFPNGRYDDQFDALLQALDWLVANESYLNMSYNPPIVFRLGPFDLRGGRDEWSNNRC
jgi:predicted phage terminase large subunit-like protein